ncbi:MAG: class I SAM-dependent methyltransferase [Crocinitomicaceae bacterium]
MADNYIDINRKLWDQKTAIHFDSEFYDVKGFLAGKDSLNPIDLELLGDLKGKKVLHLQCHFGQDTISLARHGAQATGVDFSAKALEKANELNQKIGTNAQFIQSDIYELPNVLDEKFDIVFTSYGTIGWLPNIQKWAEVVHHFLKPGGKFVMIEFHPVVWMMSDDFQKIEYSYLNKGEIIEETEGTYTDRNADIKEQSISWNHGLSEVISALIKSGLSLKEFKEYDYSPYNCFRNTVKIEEGKFQIQGLEGILPMMYSLVFISENI